MTDKHEEAAIVGLFLQQYARDHEEATVRPLAEYQRRFPGFEAAIAAEYHALRSGTAVDEDAASAAAAPVAADPSPGARFTVGEEIARGGMGVIYRVWDRDLRRSLAMKALRADDGSAGASSRDPHALHRFLREARITGQLEHPGIVPVHALGLDDDGRIYFIMSMIRGEDLSRIFERARDPDDAEWTLPRALDVLLRVCDAVAFAHDRGVVHRDLKPRNVRIGEFGETYVMDWGLARVMDGEAVGPDVAGSSNDIASASNDDAGASNGAADARHTLEGDVFGTPSYMPPEQARGAVQEVDYRADVYAIGAMLYELLAGRAPYLDDAADSASHAVLDRVKSGPPRPLESHGTNPPPELVAVCEKAMAREPDDRYPSVFELGRDLRAFLEQRVVRAYEIGAFAELRKWVQRNRALAATGMLAVAALLVGIVSTAYYARVADAQAKRSERSFELASQAIDQMLEEVGDKSLRGVPQMTPVREKLLAAAKDLQMQLIEQRRDDPEARFSVGEAHARLARVRNLMGDYQAAQQNREAALSIFEQLLRIEPDRRAYRVALARAEEGLGITLSRRGEFDRAIAMYERAEKSFAALARDYPEDASYREKCARVMDRGASSRQLAGRDDEAIALRARAFEQFRLDLKRRPSPDLRAYFASALRNHALVYIKRMEFEKADEFLVEAIALAEALVAEDPEDMEYRHNLAQCRMTRHSTVRRLKGPDAAEPLLLAAIEEYRRLVASFPFVAYHHRDLAGAIHNLGNVQSDRGKLEEAARCYREALEQQRKALAIAPQDEISLRYLTFHMNSLAQNALRAGDHAEGVKWALELGVDPKAGKPRLTSADYVGYALDLAKQDARLDAATRDRLTKQYTSHLWKLVKDAAALGVRHADLIWASTFDPIRSYEEYPEILARIEASGTQAERSDFERTRVADAKCLFGQSRKQVEQLQAAGWRVTDVAADANGSYAVVVVKDHPRLRRRRWWQPDTDEQGIAAFLKNHRQAVLVDLEPLDAEGNRFAAVWIQARKTWKRVIGVTVSDMLSEANKLKCRIVGAAGYARSGEARCAGILWSNEMEDRREWGIGGDANDDWSATGLFSSTTGPSVPIRTKGPPLRTTVLTGKRREEIEAALAENAGSRITTITARRDRPGTFDAILLFDAMRK